MASALPGQVDSVDEAIKASTDCFFFLFGGCKHGEGCPFRHSAAARANGTGCRFWSRGFCKAGKTCPFRHNQRLMGPVEDRSQVPCFYFSQGYCAKGVLCPFLHSSPGDPAAETNADGEPSVIVAQPASTKDTAVDQNGEIKGGQANGTFSTEVDMEMEKSSQDTDGNMEMPIQSEGMAAASKNEAGLTLKRKAVEDNIEKRQDKGIGHQNVKQKLSEGGLNTTSEVANGEKSEPGKANGTTPAVKEQVGQSLKLTSGAFVHSLLQGLSKAAPLKSKSMSMSTSPSKLKTAPTQTSMRHGNNLIVGLLENPHGDGNGKPSESKAIPKKSESRVSSSVVAILRHSSSQASSNAHNTPQAASKPVVRTISPVNASTGFSAPRSLGEILAEKRRAKNLVSPEASEMIVAVPHEAASEGNSVVSVVKETVAAARNPSRGGSKVIDANSEDSTQSKGQVTTVQNSVREESASAKVRHADSGKSSANISKPAFQAPRPLSELLQKKRKSGEESDSERPEEEAKPSIRKRIVAAAQLSRTDVVNVNGTASPAKNEPLSGETQSLPVNSDDERTHLKSQTNESPTAVDTNNNEGVTEIQQESEATPVAVPKSQTETQQVIATGTDFPKEDGLIEQTEDGNETTEGQSVQEEPPKPSVEVDEMLIAEEGGFEEGEEDALDETLVDIDPLVESDDEDFAKKFDHYFR